MGPRQWPPHGTATATWELLKACSWGPEGKKSVGELLPLLGDYFYADNWDFLTVCRLRSPIFTSQDLAPSSLSKVTSNSIVYRVRVNTRPALRGSCSWAALPLGRDGLGSQGALAPSPHRIPFFD